MFGTHTQKSQKIRYRYYVCSRAQKYGYHTCSVRSLNANEIENLVAECLFMRPEGSGYKERWPFLTANDRKSILVNHIKRIEYSAEGRKIHVSFLNGCEQEYSADLKGVQHRNIYDPKEDVVKEPKLRQILLLAHHVGRLLESGEVKSVKRAAQWMNMSAIRLHLIMELLFISPRIQEEILLGQNEAIAAIPEYKATLIAREPDWGKQYDSWHSLVKKPTDDPAISQNS